MSIKSDIEKSEKIFAPYEIPVDVTSYEQYAKDVFETAIEGGIDYWADIHEWVSDDEGRAWYAKVTVKDDYYEDVAGSVIDWWTIMSGTQRLATQPPANDVTTVTQVIAALKEAAATDDYEKFLNMYDVEWADIIVQYGLFGELVFG
tara:strand:+ start:391 stop:831 length:441 start_codon:yes stop_codon:yes gene_type:complete